jgi:hypothetical protein
MLSGVARGNRAKQGAPGTGQKSISMMHIDGAPCQQAGVGPIRGAMRRPGALRRHVETAIASFASIRGNNAIPQRPLPGLILCVIGRAAVVRAACCCRCRWNGNQECKISSKVIDSTLQQAWTWKNSAARTD